MVLVKSLFVYLFPESNAEAPYLVCVQLKDPTVKKIILLAFIILSGTINLMGQGSRNEKKILTYETLYDAPYEINKLWVQFQPVYTELSVMNPTAGFGVEATYYWADKFDFRAHFRKPYGRQTDYQRNIAFYNAPEVDNDIAIFNYFEIGGTYHIKDREEDTETFIHLYSQRYTSGNKWKSMVPEKSRIPTKVRKILGARAGSMVYKTNFNLDRVMEDDGVQLLNAEGVALPATVENPFTRVNVKGGYAGASYAWIKNVAIDPDRSYSDLVKDLIITAYADILFAGQIEYSDVFYRKIPYAADGLGKNYFGFRAGLDGKFNRTLSWGYNGEIGYRPGVQGKGFYALIKISFPVYSTDLDNRVEAFSK